MCTQVPVKVVRILHDRKAIVQDENGNEKTVSLELLGCATYGDYVTYRNGYAVRKFNPKEARDVLSIAEKMRSLIALAEEEPTPQMALAF